MEEIERGIYKFYLKDMDVKLDKNKSGKWMYFYNFENVDYAQQIAKNAVEQGCVEESKFQFKQIRNEPQGLVCFYLNADDIETHQKILTYMLKQNLIKRTKTGKLYNISFKLNTQTRLGLYANEYVSEIKLDKFINLETGKWIYD